MMKISGPYLNWLKIGHFRRWSDPKLDPHFILCSARIPAARVCRRRPVSSPSLSGRWRQFSGLCPRSLRLRRERERSRSLFVDFLLSCGFFHGFREVAGLPHHPAWLPGERHLLPVRLWFPVSPFLPFIYWIAVDLLKGNGFRFLFYFPQCRDFCSDLCGWFLRMFRLLAAGFNISFSVVLLLLLFLYRTVLICSYFLLSCFKFIILLIITCM